jgi:outer membrane protein assembly factor BamB
VAGDGKIYVASSGGVVTVCDAKSMDVVASHDFGERISATPVIADGRIYLRTEKALYCFANR